MSLMEIPVTILTIERVRKAIADNHKIDPEIDLDEPNVAILCTTHGWMFNDGSSTMGFYLKGHQYDEPDNMTYLKEQLSWIKRNPDEA